MLAEADPAAVQLLLDEGVTIEVEGSLEGEQGGYPHHHRTQDFIAELEVAAGEAAVLVRQDAMVRFPGRTFWDTDAEGRPWLHALEDEVDSAGILVCHAAQPGPQVVLFAGILQLGLIPPNTKLPPRNPGDPAWDDLSEEERTVYTRFMAAFAGFLEHTDEQIGRVVGYLKEHNLFENTAILLLSDNGGAPGAGTKGGFARPYGDRTTVAEMSARLAGLKELWWSEAANNGGLPLLEAMKGCGRTYDQALEPSRRLPPTR